MCVRVVWLGEKSTAGDAHTGLCIVSSSEFPILFNFQECRGCGEKIFEDDVYVYGHLAGEDAFWHPNCFTCCTCDELLVNLIYGVGGDEIFCARHHAEQIKPRCNGCDEVN